MATEQSFNSDNIVTLSSADGLNLSLASADIKGMTVTDTGALVLTLSDGQTLTVSNFQSLAQDGAVITLADGAIMETRNLYQQLAEHLPAKDVATPAPGTIVNIDLLQGRTYNFSFDGVSPESVEQKGDALVVVFDNGGQLILNGYAAALDADTPPELNFNGEFLSVQEFSHALRLAALIEDGMQPEEAPVTQTAKIEDISQAEIDMAALAQQLAQVEPAAGDSASSAASASAGGFGFQSNVTPVDLGAINPIGPHGFTELPIRTPEFRDDSRGPGANPPAGPQAPIPPGIESGNKMVYEDGSVTIDIVGQSNGGPGIGLTIIVSGIPSGWGVVPNGGTYNPATGTVTYNVPPGTVFTGGPTLSPPADSDEDIPALVITGINTDLSTGLTSTVTTVIKVIVDAVADAPYIKADDDIGQEGTTLDVVVDTRVTDTDGSEEITSIVITGVPADFTLSAGVHDPVTGHWTLTPDQLVGLTITPPPHFVGTLPLVAISTSTEVNKSGDEFDTTNDSASSEDPFTVTWLPNPPTVVVTFPPNDPPTNPPGNPNDPQPTSGTLDAENAWVKEDNSIGVNVVANLREGFGADEVLTVTVEGIDASWGFAGPGGTYDAAAGTWTITLPAGTNFNGTLTFTPPAQSDVDLNGLKVTATSYVPATDTTLTDDASFNIIVDAVADTPEITADGGAAIENTAIAVNIAGKLGVDDFDNSESITGYEISGVPAGYTFSAGTDLGNGTWSFTPDQIVGLTISAPLNAVGSLTLTAKVLTQDTPSDREIDNSDNTNSATDDFTVTWGPKPPTVVVTFPPNDPPTNPPGNPNDPNPTSGTLDAENAWVKEDNSIDVSINANLREGHGADEVLTVTVEGIDPSWGFAGPGGTYDAAAGTWTITLPAGQNFSGTLTFTPPAQSDVDLNNLKVTAESFVPAVNASESVDTSFNIIVDAVADTPEITADGGSALEGAAIAINIAGKLGVDDFDNSESITGYEISGVPAGYTFSAGTDLGNGTWSFTPAEIVGLTLSAPLNAVGSLTLTAKVLTQDAPSDREIDNSDNTNSATDDFTVTWGPKPPTVVVTFPPNDPPTNPPGNPNDPNPTSGTLDAENAWVKEDNSIDVNINANLREGFGADEVLTVTVEGIDASWGFVPPAGGTYDAAAGTWTITLPPGQNFNGTLTFTPPAQSDVDLNNLKVTADSYVPATDSTQSADTSFNIIVDAVADTPEITAEGGAAIENTAIAINISGKLGVDDFDNSESITGYEISGVPAGYTFSAGTDLGNGTWSFTPDQIVGLTMTAPQNAVGSLTLTAKVLTQDAPSDREVDNSDNTNSATDTFTVTWGPNPPTVVVTFPPNDPPTNPPGNPNDPNPTSGTLDAENAWVKEDNSIDVNINANLRTGHGADEVLTVTVTGIDASWGFVPPAGGNYDAAAGTWTITLPAGQNFNDVLTFTPPAQSDVDLNGLTVTATSYVPATDTTLSDDATFNIIVDAVADTPEITAEGGSAKENEAIAINISGKLGVDDFDDSESITGYEISGVPAGYTFSAGTDLGNGTWSFTPDQIVGLTMTAPQNAVGKLTLTAKVLTQDAPSDREIDNSDNTNSATDSFTVTWGPNPPTVVVTFPPNEPPTSPPTNPNDPNPTSGTVDAENAWVKEDNSIDVNINANLREGHGADEVLTVTVTGIDASWGFVPPAGGTYDAANGTWTITLPPGQNFNGTLTFTPPADSDVDLNGLKVTAESYVPATDTTLSDDATFNIIVDAVADAPELTVDDARVEEGRSVALNIETRTTDVDGSEIIEKVIIENVPAGATLNKGEHKGNGVWELSQDDLQGLTITVPDGITGNYYLKVTVVAYEHNPNGTELDYSDNRAEATTTLKLCVTPDAVPIITQPDAKEVDETNLSNGNLTAGDRIVVDFGNDAPGVFTLDGMESASTALYSGGVEITLERNDRGDILGMAGDRLVFTVTLDSATGEYLYTQIGTLDHPNTDDHDDVITLKFNFSVKDADGDTAEGLITIDVRDDGPTANNDVNTYNTADGGAAGNVITGENGGAGAADNLSQDGTTTVKQIKFGDQVVDVPESGTVTINGSHGSLTIAADGSYEYNLFPVPPSGGTVVTHPHEFGETRGFPALTEGRQISGDSLNNLGINAGDLTVAHSGTGTVTFVSEGAGYDNTLGMYTVAADGTLQAASVLIKNGNAVGTGFSTNFTANAGETLGFFIVADGNNTNGGYKGLDFSTGTLSFVYKHGTGAERPATINDNGQHVKLVFTGADGKVTVLKGDVYHTTERGDSANLNPDGTVRVVSGLPDGNDNGTLRIGFEDLPCLGDKDYEDIIFDVSFTGTTVVPGTCPEDEFTYVIVDGDGDTSEATLTLDGVCPPVSVDVSVGPEAGGHAIVKEDQSVFVPVKAIYAGGNGNETVTLTLNGVDAGWDLSGTGWEPTGVAGQYTLTLAAGQRVYDGGITLSPPADSDVDLESLSVTVTVSGPDAGDNASKTDSVKVVVDAVIDTPTLEVSRATGKEGETVALDIRTAVGDTDGSETITHVTIADLPPGATLNKGTFADGVWTLSQADLNGLTVKLPANAKGWYHLKVTTYAAETNLSGLEVDYSDNQTSVSTKLKLIVNQNFVPVITEPVQKVVDETDLVNGNQTVRGDITVSYGNDGPGKLTLNGTNGSSVGPLTSGGAAVVVTAVAGGFVGTANGKEIFTLTLTEGGRYNFVLKGTLDHPDKGDHNDAIDLYFGFTATDADGDTADGAITIRVLDDGVVARDDYADFTVGGSAVHGNVFHNDTLSQDLGNSVTKVTFKGQDYAVSEGQPAVVKGDYGTLTIHANGDATYVSNGKGSGTVYDKFTYTLTDGDGDSSSAMIKMIGCAPPPVLVVGENAPDDKGSKTPFRVGDGKGKISGGDGADILIGDVGGASSTAQNKDYNIVMVLDVSSSMGYGWNSRLEQLKTGVKNLLNDFNDYEGGVVKVHIVPFNSCALDAGTFTVTNARDLDKALDYVTKLWSDGYTNYEAAMISAIDYLEGSKSAKPIAGAETITYFISDGEPNYYVNNWGGVIHNLNAEVAMNQIRGRGHDGDRTNEIAKLKALSEVIGVGINIGPALKHLSEISTSGSALNITNPAHLTNVLAGLNPINALATTGDDVLSGGNGNDLIFGDSVFTDVLAVAQGLNTPAGEGWGVFERLEAGQGIKKDWSRADTIEYIRNNIGEVARESYDVHGNPREGGNDTIYGGAGNDIIFGQNGNDTIYGGDGDDYLDGGSGNDVIYGGAGDDIIDGGAGDDILYGDDGNDVIYGGTGNDTLYGGAGDDHLIGEEGNNTLYGGAGADTFWMITTDGVDTIKDFKVAEGDRLELSQLLKDHYDPLQNAINDFVFTRVENGSTIVSVDLTGSGNASNAVDITVLEGVSTTLNDLLNTNSVLTSVA